MKRIKPKLLFVLACYLLAALLYLGASLFGFFRAGGLPEQTLHLADFELVSMVEGQEENTVVSTMWDPRLLYRCEPTRVDTAVFYGESNKPGGEMVLYYTTPRQPDYSETAKVWARQRADGGWQFDLGGKKVTSLRLDLDVIGSVIWRFDGFVINPAQPLWQYLVPDAMQAALLATLPGFGAAALLEAGRALLWRCGARKRKK